MWGLAVTQAPTLSADACYRSRTDSEFRRDALVLEAANYSYLSTVLRSTHTLDSLSRLIDKAAETPACFRHRLDKAPT